MKTDQKPPIYRIDDPDAPLPKYVRKHGIKHGKPYVLYEPGCWQLMSTEELAEYRRNLERLRS